MSIIKLQEMNVIDVDLVLTVRGKKIPLRKITDDSLIKLKNRVMNRNDRQELLNSIRKIGD